MNKSLRDEKVCCPISDLNSVWQYTKNPPKWITQIVDIKPRSDFVIKNTSLTCHTESNRFAPATRFDRHTTPRTLVCHDMKGGYIEDKFIDPLNKGNCYTFYRWSQIDIFIYFSHHLVTIPPLAWINAAHSNGVQILGTFITEWEPGKAVCEEIFASPKSLKKFVNILVEICVLFKLDGWLLNIENGLDDTGPLKTFVKQLTEKMHMKRPGSLVLWYDSITDEGKLKWQNELNANNRCYFDNCDGIFLNYSWNEENLVNTYQAAEHRRHDVYVGVDVFGRNFYGGGNFNTYLAVEKIREHDLSIAIFAQGWTHETLDPEPADTFLERFLARDNAFWKSLWPYLYSYPINRVFETFFYVGVDKPFRIGTS
ncbi:cytosolic endo-beta-N-acetylglucosaminidase isoform X2 [Photinus pyralis]|uniref:cytosolic endo-beta-N-acetylglucosaminidase isoform X2 n=1 Tax=Photinus pyralis TaxID=7054 RepID=UPI0012676668|nr:cytosolic endo-beta-N-acetylglucosaminidase isoform X2 [Photinus pyralis]